MGSEPTVLAAGNEGHTNRDSPTGSSQLLHCLPLSLKDMGYEVSHVTRKYPDSQLGDTVKESSTTDLKIIYDYFQITSSQMLIPDEVVACVQELWPEKASSPVLTYLANGIQKATDDPDTLSVPYSTISAIEPADLKVKSIGFVDSSLDSVVKLNEDEVLVNSWLADQLQIGPGKELCFASMTTCPKRSMVAKSNDHSPPRLRPLFHSPNRYP